MKHSGFTVIHYQQRTYDAGKSIETGNNPTKELNPHIPKETRGQWGKELMVPRYKCWVI